MASAKKTFLPLNSMGILINFSNFAFKKPVMVKLSQYQAHSANSPSIGCSASTLHPLADLFIPTSP